MEQLFSHLTLTDVHCNVIRSGKIFFQKNWRNRQHITNVVKAVSNIIRWKAVR